MPNINSTISRHKTVLNSLTNTNERTRNCINKTKCLLQEKCLTSNILYKVTTTSSECNCQHKIHSGINKNKLKKRFANYTKPDKKNTIVHTE